MPDWELSLIFLLSHSRSRAHEGESGQNWSPSEALRPKISSFLALISLGSDEGKTTARDLTLLRRLSKKILRWLKLHASKDCLNQRVHSHEYCWVIKDRCDWYRQIGNTHSLQNEREFQILQRTWARTYSLVWRAMLRIRLFCLNVITNKNFLSF